MGRDGPVMVVLCLDGTEVASWPLAGRDPPDLAVVDELARLALIARRLGGQLRLRNAGPDVAELLELCGLGEVITASREA
ncbi:MAG: STAS domain-containing protein [Acidimicrobiia bacterium]